MKSLKQKERIGIGLYIIAIVLLVFSAISAGANNDNSYIEIGGWAMFLVASIYAIWLVKEKKKLANSEVR